MADFEVESSLSDSAAQVDNVPESMGCRDRCDRTDDGDRDLLWNHKKVSEGDPTLVESRLLTQSSAAF